MIISSELRSISPVTLRVHTYPIFFENRGFFSPVLPEVYMHVFDENGDRKKFKKKKTTFSSVEIFENVGLSFLSMISYSYRAGHAL